MQPVAIKAAVLLQKPSNKGEGEQNIVVFWIFEDKKAIYKIDQNNLSYLKLYI